ncbi:hypothetical protein [Microcoleus sp. A006_D1]|uniref:hypothetical protein n=1 Tax=Microcoleus sp. A006_D1 TaxID=3055267 RepID=UPI002FD19193
MPKKARDIGGKIQALGLKIVSGSVLPMIGKVTGEEKTQGSERCLNLFRGLGLIECGPDCAPDFVNS